jgi:cytochrome c-type biogenesis protein CcmH
MVDGLDTRLKAGGGTPDEWLRLVRSRVVLGEQDQAAAALARARTALAADPQGLAQVEQGARAVGLGGGDGSTRPAEAGPAARAETEAAMAAVRAMPQAERDAALLQHTRGAREGGQRP